MSADGLKWEEVFRSGTCDSFVGELLQANGTNPADTTDVGRSGRCGTVGEKLYTVGTNPANNAGVDRTGP